MFLHRVILLLTKNTELRQNQQVLDITCHRGPKINWKEEENVKRSRCIASEKES